MAKLLPYVNFYRPNTTELDLREELRQTLYGSTEEVPKGRVGLLRKMRRDSSGNLIRCTCRNELSDKPSTDSYCRYCHGMGFYWDERQITYFLSDAAYRKQATADKEYNSNLIYVEYNVEVTDSDYIISIRTDRDGNVIIPVERLVFYKIAKAIPFKSDFGRIEFFTLRAEEEQKWSTWYGVPNRQS